MELLNNAWAGWQNYITNGKYAVLLLAVLVWYWFGGNKKKELPLMLYSTLATAGCILPVSAAMLMKYQTAFYDYQWIWNYVPVTLVIAYGGVLFLTEGKVAAESETGIDGLQNAIRKNKHRAVLSLMVLALIGLCGKLGQPVFDEEVAKQQRDSAVQVLDVIAEDALADENIGICLWAPREIMVSARSLQPEFCLVYGRNMWDAALGAYTYETYSEKEEMLYLWMEHVQIYGTPDGYTSDGTFLEGAKCMQLAAELGVNRILLPGNMQETDVQVLAGVLGVTVQQIGEYYLLAL